MTDPGAPGAQVPFDATEGTHSSSQTQVDEDEILHLVAHPDENVSMVQIGHLQSWFSSKMRSADVHVPVVTAPPVVASLISSLFLFPNLTSLRISIAKPGFVMRQAIFSAISELAQLRLCHLEGGSLPALNLEVLRSLRKLEEFHLKPCKSEGLEDEHVAGLAHLNVATLKSLAFRGSNENLSDEGLQHLSALHSLTELQILPLGLGVTRQGVTKLLTHLPRLASLSAGLQQVGQVIAVRDCSRVQRLSLVANDPDATAGEWSTLLSNCTLCLQSSLVTLRMGLLKVQDASFMLAIATLSQLTELKFAVRPASLITPPFCCDITTLTSLQRLASLDIACTAQVPMAFTPRTVSLCALAWPQLRSLSLSVMGRAELVPESLALLDLFRGLRSLSLCCALDYAGDPGDSGGGAADPEALQHTPLSLQYLPLGLQHLQLEHVQLQQPKARGSSSGAGRPPLPRLLSLQLDDCHVDDSAFDAVLGASMLGLRQLELNCVDGLSEQGLYSSLAPLTGLQHMVMSSLTAGPSSGDAAKAPRASSWSLEQLLSAMIASAPSLLHLEWAPHCAKLQPLSATQAGHVIKLLASFSSLRFLCIQATGDAGHAALEGQQRTSPSWVEELQHTLPLCSVTSDLVAAMVTYDIFNDTIIHATGPP